MLRNLVKSAAMIMILGSCTSASAAPIVFTTSGANGVSGQASFEFGPSSFTVTLENLTGSIGLTVQELVGLTFSLVGSGSPTLTSVSAAAILDCSGDHEYPCDPYLDVLPLNDGWEASTSAGITTLKPSGFHPYAIINANYTLPGSGNGNLANPQHNPFLLGPVTFAFSGAFSDASNVTFLWGSAGSSTDGVRETETNLAAVPEPSSLVLFGTGLAWLGRRARRRAAAGGN